MLQDFGACHLNLKLATAAKPTRGSHGARGADFSPPVGNEHTSGEYFVESAVCTDRGKTETTPHSKVRLTY